MAVKSKNVLNNILGNIPPGLRTPLIDAFNTITKNYIERRWEPSELNGGKLCEVVYSILEGYIQASYPAKPKKPQNMLVACGAFEKADKTKFNRSIRIQIPRMLIAIYEVRNNRGVGHVGGVVDPNYMDATLVMNMSKWLMAELVRIFHNVDITTATSAVESLIEKTSPLVWEVDGKKRVLDVRLTMEQSVLVLLYHCNTAVGERDLLSWTEYTNSSLFRGVLTKLHKSKRFIEYDKIKKIVHLSPLGVDYVEKEILVKSQL